MQAKGIKVHVNTTNHSGFIPLSVTASSSLRVMNCWTVSVMSKLTYLFTQAGPSGKLTLRAVAVRFRSTDKIKGMIKYLQYRCTSYCDEYCPTFKRAVWGWGLDISPSCDMIMLEQKWCWLALLKPDVLFWFNNPTEKLNRWTYTVTQNKPGIWRVLSVKMSYIVPVYHISDP